MILKYAVFTLAVSIIPLIMILKDLNFTSELFTFFMNNVPYANNLELIKNVFSTGFFTFLTSSLNDENKITNGDEVFTKKKLQGFRGNNGNPLYLAILGNVFDVTKGSKYYGPGESYHAFTGRDGSRAFITGDFTESGLTEDVEDLTLQEVRSLNDWLKFYRKEYTYKGKLDGRYYDTNGNPTKHFHNLQLRIQEAERDEEDKNKNKLMFPPCNVEWTPEEGSRVWCTKKSGGVDRSWVGVPRKLYEPGAETYRCACVDITEQQEDVGQKIGRARFGNLEEYTDCHPKSSSCNVYTCNEQGSGFFFRRFSCYGNGCDINTIQWRK